MQNEMIERVAEAMARDTTSEVAFYRGDNKAGWEQLARAAIATMREPNEAMVLAGLRSGEAGLPNEYTAMVDAALLP